jgi:general secretion pathway protein E
MNTVQSKIPIEFLQKAFILPLEEEGEVFKVGFAPESSREALEDIRLFLNKEVLPVSLTHEEVEEGLRQLLMQDIEKPLEEEETLVLTGDEAQDLLSFTKDAPIVRLVNTLFLRAVESRASDIHIEPYEQEALVRMRVDGILHEIINIPKSQSNSVVARIKVMAKLNLAEHRLPQDGRMRVKAGEKVIDVRISIVPTLFGERVVMRLLDHTMQLLTLEKLGLWEDDYQKLKALIDHPYGSILFTGPTGSGKSTSLYAILLEVRSPQRNIITIEDPVEYQVPGIGQIPVNTKIGITFAAGLRSILRQDPDVILVGEIRDPETAEIVTHAALTGHLVLSTLHTNDAPSSIARLVDMGVESYLIASSLLGVVAQRLIRRLCKCKESYIPQESEIQQIGLNPDQIKGKSFYRPVGCPICLGTGYMGRISIFEIMPVDDDMRSLIVRTPEATVLRKVACSKGMKTLQEDAARKVLAGITSVSEVLRATQM